MAKFFEKEGLLVRESILKDVDELSKKLRESDIEEIWASGHLKPYEALKVGLEDSVICLSVVWEEEVYAMFGVNPISLVGNYGVVWLLASEDLKKIRLRFLRHSKKFIEFMLLYYPTLINYVDDRNEDSIEWLRFCGAGIGEPEKYGVENKPFRLFLFQR